MDYGALMRFVREGMRLSHVYQPLVIKYLALKGGEATVRELAVLCLTGGEDTLKWLESRLRKMPLPVLESHGVVETEGDRVRLTTRGMTPEQTARLVGACEQRLEEFLHRRGLVKSAVAAACADPVPDLLRASARGAGDAPRVGSPDR